MDYMRWTKVHPRVRYELTASGIPHALPADFGGDRTRIDLDERGAYGDPELIARIAQRYHFSAGGIVPVPGVSSANFIAVAVAVPRGGTILVEAPLYQPIRRVAEFLGLNMVPIARDPDRNFSIEMAALDQGLKQRPAALLVTNLHNPSGQLIARDVMRSLVDRAASCGVVVIVDEVYLDATAITGGGPLWTAAALGDHVISVNSLTKVYGLSALRSGWILANERIAERARDMMDLLSVMNAAPSMLLAATAFDNMTRLEERFRNFHREGQAVYRPWLEGETRVRGYPNQGAIFECFRLPAGVSSTAFNELLVSRFDTQVTPGTFFELDDHVRIGTMVPPADLTEGLSRISAALTQVLK